MTKPTSLADILCATAQTAEVALELSFSQRLAHFALYELSTLAAQCVRNETFMIRRTFRMGGSAVFVRQEDDKLIVGQGIESLPIECDYKVSDGHIDFELEKAKRHLQQTVERIIQKVHDEDPHFEMIKDQLLFQAGGAVMFADTLEYDMETGNITLTMELVLQH